MNKIVGKIFRSFERSQLLALGAILGLIDIPNCLGSEIEIDAYKMGMSCERGWEKPQFASVSEERRALRSLYGEVQYQVLNRLVSRLVGLKANLPSELNSEEYQNWLKTITNNQCSKNISVMSLKKLQTLLASDSKQQKSARKVGVKEVWALLTLFQDFCSWESFDLYQHQIHFYLQNPILLSMVFQDRKKSNQSVLCQGPVCRPVRPSLIEAQFPFADGQTNVVTQHKFMWCHHVHRRRFLSDEVWRTKWDIGKTKQELKKREGLIFALPRLLSDVSDPLIEGDSGEDMGEFVLSQTLKSIDDWTGRRLGNLERTLAYEAPIKMNFLDSRTTFPGRFRDQFNFSLTKGPMDDHLKSVDKLSFTTDLKLKGSDLYWKQLQWTRLRREKYDQKILDNFRTEFQTEIALHLSKSWKVFQIPVWPVEKVAGEMVDVLLTDFEQYEKELMKTIKGQQVVKVRLKMFVGVFALRFFYRSHNLRLEKEIQKQKEREKILVEKLKKKQAQEKTSLKDKIEQIR